MDTVLFDLDGTIVDSSWLILKSLASAVAVAGQPDVRPTGFRWGRPLADMLLEMCPQRQDEGFRAYQHCYAENRHLLELYPGVRRLLEELSADGFTLAVVTTKGSDPAREDLLACSLDGLFAALVGADDVSRLKPDPEPVLRALESTGAAAGRSIMVGDTPGDIEAGRAAGLRTAGVLWGPDPGSLMRHGLADAMFEDPSDLLRWCRHQLSP